MQASFRVGMDELHPLLPISAPLAAACALAVLWAGEAIVPLFAHGAGTFRHKARNAALGAINGVVRSVLFAALTLWVSEASRTSELGLLHAADAPAWLAWIVALLVLDLWHYAFHVGCHFIGPLWRLHAVHHTDAHVDASSAMRFHVLEVVVQSALTLPLMALMGITIEQLLVYELILLPVAMFHHANIRLPERADRLLRLVIVTPSMHFVHHSRWQPETDSNFSSVLSVWDRAFGTLRLRPRPETIALGLDGFAPAETESLGGLVKLPFGASRSLPGMPPRAEDLRPASATARPQPDTQKADGRSARRQTAPEAGEGLRSALTGRRSAPRGSA